MQESLIEQILGTLTLEEKSTMLHGVSFFRSGAVEDKGIPAVVTSNGPMGVRNEFPDDSWFPVGLSDDYVSYLPSNSAVAATWNPKQAFGHGLSYTSFAYDNLRVEMEQGAAARGDLEEPLVKLSLDVTNTGKTAGAEIVQCYVGDSECSVERPVKELKAFAKVFLEPGETKQVNMELPGSAFAFYDVQSHGFVVEPGEFVLSVGGASDRIWRQETVTLL